jgi:hypothetical protein
MGCFEGFMGNNCGREKECGCKEGGFGGIFGGGSFIWLLLLLCCGGGECLCEILPLLLILSCVCGKRIF